MTWRKKHLPFSMADELAIQKDHVNSRREGKNHYISTPPDRWPKSAGEYVKAKFASR
jgi:hypothetical protein